MAPRVESSSTQTIEPDDALDWQRSYWNDLSERPDLQPVIDPDDDDGNKNRTLADRHDRAVRVFLHDAGIDHIGTILDFGCGIGRHHALLSSIADRYVGVDIAPGMLHRAPGDVRLIDGVHLPFDDASLDCIFSFWVLQHVTHDGTLAAILAEFRRCARGGGHVILCERSARTRTEPGRPAPYIRRRTPSEYETAFGRAGFRLQRRRRLDAPAWWRRWPARPDGEHLYAFAA